MPESSQTIPFPIEARKLYAALFHGEIPPILEERLHLASERLNAAAAPADLAAYYQAITTVGDLESLELAARLTRRLPLLTRKLQALAYLAETLPDHQHDYVNYNSSFVRAALVITWEGVTSVLKALKGFVLLRRVGHA
jgi:hypothetical protein